MTAAQARVQPAGNRMLIFTTMTKLPRPPGRTDLPEDVARRSMALYYFTEESSPVRKATNYRARPQETGIRRAAIAVDRSAVDVYDRAKPELGISDQHVSRALERLNRLRRSKNQS